MHAIFQPPGTAQTMNPLKSSRAMYLLGFLACAGLLGYAYYVQYALYLDPCPLCILQRMAFFLTGLLLLAGALHNPGRTGYRVYGSLAAFFSFLGIGVAGRHLWLQSLPPDQVPACGPGLEYLVSNFPLTDAFAMIFRGSGSCATVDWLFLGLAMPAWTLIWYLLLAGVAVAWGFRRRPV